MIIYYDSSVDALDIRLLPSSEVAKSITVDERRNVDVDLAGKVVSIEIMGASRGFDVEDLLENFDLAAHKDDLSKLAAGKLPASSL